MLASSFGHQLLSSPTNSGRLSRNRSIFVNVSLSMSQRGVVVFRFHLVVFFLGCFSAFFRRANVFFLLVLSYACLLSCLIVYATTDGITVPIQ